MLQRLLYFARLDALGFPLWVLVAMMAFFYLVDRLTGERLTHGR